MVGPLVHNAEGALHAAQVGHGILGKDGKAKARNHLRNTVVNLRVKVVGAAGKHNSPSPHDNHLGQRLLTCLLGLPSEGLLLLPGSIHGTDNLLHRDVEFFPQLLMEPNRQPVLVVDGQEGIHKGDGGITAEGIHIVAKHLRVAGDDGAVVVVARTVILLDFVRSTGIEDELDSLLQQGLHVAVGNLSRIAHGLGGDGLQSHLVDGTA